MDGLSIVISVAFGLMLIAIGVVVLSPPTKDGYPEVCVNGVVYYGYESSRNMSPKVDSETLTFVRCVNE